MGSKTKGVLWSAFAFVLLSFSGAALYGARANVPSVEKPQTAGQTSLSLITEPQDGMAPIEGAIESASSSIDIVMYEFEDPQLEQLLAQEVQKGIAVRVILDNGYFGAGSSVNQEAFDYFQSNGVQVRWSPEYFALTHEKSLVIDSNVAIIMTLNFSPEYYKSDRDFGIVDSDQNDVAAMEQAFNSDWNGQNAQAQSGDELLWSPDARPQLVGLINSATSSLEIYNEEMNDPQILAALEAAARRGVDVAVDMTYSANWKSAFQSLSEFGVHVHTYTANAPLYIHAKVIIADDARAFVGSENFSASSLDQNRELGIIVSDPAIVAQLTGVFQKDWQGASPFLVQ